MLEPIINTQLKRKFQSEVTNEQFSKIMKMNIFDENISNPVTGNLYFYKIITFFIKFVLNNKFIKIRNYILIITIIMYSINILYLQIHPYINII